MTDYIMLIALITLLAGFFACNKIYTKRAGAYIYAGCVFNIYLGLFTAAIFLCVRGFRLEITLYSLLMAFLFALCVGMYTIIGFKVMEAGSLAVYTVFLMFGGMILPFLYGLSFLGESFSILKTFGLVLLSVAIVLTGKVNEGKSIAYRILLLYALAFLLNGCASILSKLHQMEPDRAVSAESFVILSSLLKAAVFAAMLPFVKRMPKEDARRMNIGTLAVILLSAAFSGAAFFLQLVVASRLPATVLFPVITGGTVVFSTAAGWLLFKEKLSRRIIAGIVLCFLATFMFW